MRFRLVSVLAAGVVLAFPGGASAIAPKTQFSYTGGEQSYVVPPGVVLLGVAAKGGHGGGPGGQGGGSAGGLGALLPVTPGQTLFAEVGSAGAYGGGAVFGGGGAAGPPPPVLAMCNGSPCGGVYASSGGGASDVRTCSISVSSCPGGVSSAATRLIVGGGGGGQSGSGSAPTGSGCGQPVTTGANANTFQYLPGNPAAGPVPIVTAAGIVYPGRSTNDTSGAVTPAGGGSNVAGTGGSVASCSANNVTWSDSVPGSNAVGPAGGTGGDASSLGPMGTCTPGVNCEDAGSGGGGGGGYFGGGGGATGPDKAAGACVECNDANSGQGGGAGSSFVSNQMVDPLDESPFLGAGSGTVVMVPVIEIDAPANGAVYTPGQVVDASWGCGFDGLTGLGIGNGCTGTVANGSPIDTSPGTHTFTVSGIVSSTGPQTASASVTYTVSNGSGGGGGGGKHVSVTAGGFKFTLTGPGAPLPKGSKLTATLTHTGKGKNFKVGKYKYYLKGTHKKPILVTKHAGTFSLPLSALRSGNHALTVVITLNSTKHHGKSKTATLKLPFTIG
jgi:hypothetical protein